MNTPPEAPLDPAMGRRTALVLVGIFVLIIAVPPLHQGMVELRAGHRWPILSLFDEFPTAASLKAFEDQLGRDSAIAARLRGPYQRFLTGTFGRGTERVLFGRDGFLFFRREVDMAIDGGFLGRREAAQHVRIDVPGGRARRLTDPVAAIVDYHRQLAARGIHLVFVPLPVKPIIYPDKVWPGYPLAIGPAWNPDRTPFVERLRAAGVDVLDITDTLWSARLKTPSSLFLKLDTHWSPTGLAIVADALAQHVRPRLGVAPNTNFVRVSRTIENRGDLFRMMELPPAGGLFAAETIEITEVHRGTGEGPRFSGDDLAPVLLLGDSFTNVYHRADLGWGEGAGLGEQLALRLGVPVHILAIDGGGATSVRERLAALPGAMAGKRVVLWTCSARDLFDENIDWDLVPLPDDAAARR